MDIADVVDMFARLVNSKKYVRIELYIDG